MISLYYPPKKCPVCGWSYHEWAFGVHYSYTADKGSTDPREKIVRLAVGRKVCDPSERGARGLEYFTMPRNWIIV